MKIKNSIISLIAKPTNPKIVIVSPIAFGILAILDF
jgi:hypothetical protein